MPIMRRNILFSNKSRKSHTLQTVIIVIVFIGLFLGFRVMFSKSYKISGHLKTAKNHILKNNYNAGLEELNKALAIDPEYALTYDGFGYLYVHKGEVEKAKEFYVKAEEKKVSNSGIFDHRNTGFDYISKGKYSLAFAEFEHLNKITERDLKGIFGMGLAYHGMGKIKEAIDTYENALNISPKNSQIISYFEKAKKERDSGNILCVLDRNGQPLLKKDIKQGKSIYPSESATAADKIIGINSEEFGKFGIEYAFREYIPGNEITLTLDLNLQKVATSVLYDQMGSIVILKPQTGEILAAVSHPKFNPVGIEKKFGSYKYNANKVFLNRAFDMLYEPGSICKIITTAAAIESNADMKDIFPVKCKGSVLIDRQTFWCWEKHGNVKDIQQAIDQSCNIAFAAIGNYLGNDKLVEFSGRFGFNSPIDMQLPVAMSTIGIESENKYETAEKANGLGKNYKITPLHAALLAAIIANNGVCMKPYLVKNIKNIKGEVIYQNNPVVLKNTIKKETAEAIKKLMIDAVVNGLGKKAKVDGVTIAGKTGTARSSRKGLDGLFIFFAPAENPEIAAAIICETGGKGMDIAAPKAKQLVQQILKK
ncbi:MAG: penicillin-binding transpeptidase domain-containing protein [Candidatus Firestonebacteria bacterium]